MAATSGNGGRSNTPHRSQKPPERSRGRGKRTIIESACTACQRRKSKCDGQRPACVRCQKLHTPCVYNAEEGESRWAALRRRNQVLEKERDTACELLTLMQSRPETEALEVYRHVRTHPQDYDMSALIHDARRSCASESPQQPPQQQQPTYPNHLQQRDHHQRPKPQTQPQQQRSQNTSYEPSTSATGTTNQLPPLRSIIQDLHTPAAGSNAKQQPLPQTSPPARPAQRQMSQASGLSDGFHSPVSSSGRQEQYSVSPREDPPPNWAHKSDLQHRMGSVVKRKL